MYYVSQFNIWLRPRLFLLLFVLLSNPTHGTHPNPHLISPVVSLAQLESPSVALKAELLSQFYRYEEYSVEVICWT